MKYPDGFQDFVVFSLEDWCGEELADTDDAIWNALMTHIFLNENVKSAEAIYVWEEVIKEFAGFSVAKEAVEDSNWSSKVLERIESEFALIKGRNGEKYKRRMLKLITPPIKNLDFLRTISKALQYFEDNEISAKKMNYRTLKGAVS